MFELEAVVGLKVIGPLLSRVEPVSKTALVLGFIVVVRVIGLSSLLITTSDW